MMMKFVAIILSIWVLVTSIGIQVFEHYCHEEGASTSFFFAAEDTCHDDEDHKHENNQKPCCSVELEDDCCTDSQELFQLNFDLVNNSPFDFKLMDVVSIQIIDSQFSENIQPSNYSSYYPNPPPLSGRDILLTKSVLII